MFYRNLIQKTLSAGLLLHLVLCFLQPQWRVFFLTALFTVGLGFSIQQIVANPLAIKMEAAHEKRQ
jgi:FHS family L-fucose permease-like MFS transporter